IGLSRCGKSIAISSMMVPGRWLMTRTRSDNVTASARSWVISSAVLFAALRVWARSCCNTIRVCASTRENGSSTSTRQGATPRRGQAVGHGARQLMRVMGGEIIELEIGKQARGAALALIGRHALDLDSERHILNDGAPG